MSKSKKTIKILFFYLKKMYYFLIITILTSSLWISLWIIFWYFLKDLEKNNINNFSLNIFKKSRIWKLEYFLFWVLPILTSSFFFIFFLNIEEYMNLEYTTNIFIFLTLFYIISIIFFAISSIKRLKDCSNLNVLYCLMPCFVLY